MSDFTKYQALGNDYLVVDPADVELDPTPDAVRLLCDRHFGIGADGILVGPIGPVKPDRPVLLRIFNSDGSECEKSGNGLRMFGLYLAERHLSRSEFTVRTIAGDSPVRVLDERAGVASVGLGVPRFAADAVPMLGVRGAAIEQPLLVGDREWVVTALHLGNPHTVVPVAEPTRELALELGPRIAGHERFPGRTNVQFLAVLDRRTIRIEIWERGAGYTLASGSSGAAAAAVAHRLGLVDAAVTVRMPGGEIDVRLGAGGAVTMTGAAEKVLTGSFAPALAARLDTLGALRGVPVGAR